MTTDVMYDSISASSIPPNATLMAGYINGKAQWQSYYQMAIDHPNDTVLSISVAAHGTSGYVASDILDIENGDASPDDAPGWTTAMRALNRPIITNYCSRLGTWPATQKAYKTQNVLPPDFWIADYTTQPHLVPGSVATQWIDAGPYDISLTNGTWPLSPITPPVINPPYKVGIYTMNPVAIQTDKNGNGWLPTSLPWSTFVAATIQGSDPSPDADNAYWPGVAKVQNRNGYILVSVVGSLPLSTINVFVATN
jgi:hypothetical protein